MCDISFIDKLLSNFHTSIICFAYLTCTNILSFNILTHFLTLMFVIFLVLLILVNYTISSSNVIICGLNKTIIFDKNDASPFFIESPGFPHSMNASEGENCRINVLLSEIDPVCIFVKVSYLKNAFSAL